MGLVKQYDVPIRAALVEWLHGIVNVGTALRHHEFAVGHGTVGYADVVVCEPQALHGFEIKSARDTLTRLEYQVKYYDRIFDTATLVVSAVHLDKARERVPERWGLIVARSQAGEVELEELRIARQSDRVEAAVDLLWREEALNVLNRVDTQHKGKYKTRGWLYATLREKVSDAVLRKLVIAELRKRKEFWWNFETPSRRV